MSQRGDSEEAAHLPSGVPGEGASKPSRSKLAWLEEHQNLIWRGLLLVGFIVVYVYGIHTGISSLKQRVSSLEEQVEEIDEQVSAVDRQVGALNYQISTLEDSVGRIEDSLMSLDEKLDAFLLELASRGVDAKSNLHLNDDKTPAD